MLCHSALRVCPSRMSVSLTPCRHVAHYCHARSSTRTGSFSGSFSRHFSAAGGGPRRNIHEHIVYTGVNVAADALKLAIRMGIGCAFVYGGVRLLRNELFGPTADCTRRSDFDSLILVVGEVGEGKSTLINKLKDKDEPDASTGMKVTGVTKQFDVYATCLFGKRTGLIDGPGIGDGEVNGIEFVQQLLKFLQQGKLDGIILCTKVNSRITIGMRIVMLIVDQCVIGKTKWRSVILCGTQADRCSQDEIDNFRNEYKDEINKCIVEGGSIETCVVTSSTTGAGLLALQQAIRELPQVKLRCDSPNTAKLAIELARILGMDVQTALHLLHASVVVLASFTVRALFGF
eukprot:TRINITY_DN108173_c0_g1_i1.p1 TRINITY_DN108173_c0_g1~~TRINITY_DN108173_c0_g1_i1.p1  ORF type:complete len:346 (-),score=17.55 TRINITY_DN108173_c0_g1_i1:96-1133(-)